MHLGADAPAGCAPYGDGVDVGARSQTWWKRLTGSDPWVLDAVLATGWLAICLVTTSVNDAGTDDPVPHDALGFGLLVAIVLPYYLRRRYPLGVLAVSMAAIVALVGFGYYEGATPLVIMFGAYSVGSWCPPRRIYVGLATVMVGLLAIYLTDPPGFELGDLATNVVVFSAFVAFGWSIQSRRLRLEALEERAQALEREHDEEARRAVADERLRIAQELHDVVAHSMGVIAVQAGVGAHVIDTDPAEAKRALQAISTTSRSSLTELRRLLGVLRDEHGDAAYIPAPGLDDLSTLVREISDAGVRAHLDLAGERSEVPLGVELTAYRIVQEALTNVLKHAGPGAAVEILVTFEQGALRIEVNDDGRGVDARSAGSGGHGLVGMRERVAVYGGSLHAGPAPSGGFRVDAVLPYSLEGADQARGLDVPVAQVES